MTTDAAAIQPEPEGESLGTRLRTNIRSGNLGSTPVIIALALVVLVFCFWIRTSPHRSTSRT